MGINCKEHAMREDRIRKAEEFARRELMKLAGYGDNTVRMAEYRFEHSCRVAHISAEIAVKEGLDAERAIIAGLLHDIGYSVEMASEEAYMDHGRIGAAIARPFLLDLGFNEKEANEICYGIAIHVDDKADFDGERTPLALTVQDADNIDRFDAFRLYESLLNAEYRDLPLAEQKQFLEKRIPRLIKLREMPCGTLTATSMWQEKIDYQIEFLSRLKAQIECSSF